jgi:hypothetical protein
LHGHYDQLTKLSVVFGSLYRSSIEQEVAADPLLEIHPISWLEPNISPIPIAVATAKPQDNLPKNKPMPRATTPTVATALPAFPVSIVDILHKVSLIGSPVGVEAASAFLVTDINGSSNATNSTRQKCQPDLVF